MMRIVMRTLAIALLVAVWFALTRNQVSLDALKLPSPEATALVFSERFLDLWSYTKSTAWRVFEGYTIGALLGVVTALVMLYNRVLGAFIDTYVEIIRPIPPIALTPFFIFWFGIGDLGQEVLIGMVSFLVFTVTLYESGTNFDSKYLKAARLLGANRWAVLRRVILPGSMAPLGGAARVAAAGAIAVSIAAEYLGAQGGLGYLIRNARVTLETDVILAAVIILGIISIVLDFGIRALFAWMTQWIPKDKRS